MEDDSNACSTGAVEAPPGTRSGYGKVAADGPGVPVPSTPRAHHVWVNLQRHRSKVATLEYPGLILGWRRGADEWEAHVVWTTPDLDGTGRTSAHLAWLPAHQLRPA